MITSPVAPSLVTEGGIPRERSVVRSWVQWQDRRHCTHEGGRIVQLRWRDARGVVLVGRRVMSGGTSSATDAAHDDGRLGQVLLASSLQPGKVLGHRLTVALAQAHNLEIRI